MPDHHYLALLRVLPWWLTAATWFALPLACCAVTLFTVWLADRRNRAPATGLHWTEAARQHFAGTKVVNVQVLTHVPIAGYLAATVGNGRLIPIGPEVHGLVVAIAVLLACQVILYRRARRVRPWLTPRSYAAGFSFQWLVILPHVAVAGLMAVFAPATFEGHEVSFAILVVGGPIAMLWLVFGGALRIGRGLRILVPPDDRLRAIAAEAMARSGNTTARVWLGRTATVNAFAFPRGDALVFTTGALAHMTAGELLPIALHELGHLAEKRRTSWLRASGLLVLTVVGEWRPLVTGIGLAGWLLLLVLSLLVARRTAARLRALEQKADDHAHAHEDDAGSYARSLERLHEVDLIPAVMHPGVDIHPDLYDRMLAAGVTPDFPRPTPPPSRQGQVRAFAILLIAFVVYLQLARARFESSSFEHPATAMGYAALTGGDANALGAIGYHWRDERPEAALALLSFVVDDCGDKRFEAWRAHVQRAIARGDKGR